MQNVQNSSTINLVKKIISAVIFSLLFFLPAVFIVPPSHAQMTSYTNPVPIYQNSEDVSIIIYSKDSFFNEDKTHTLGLWSPDGKVHYLVSKSEFFAGFSSLTFCSGIRERPSNPCDFKASEKEVDGKPHYFLTVDLPESEIEERGVWKYKLWLGGHNGLKKESLIYEGGFEVLSPNQIKDGFPDGIGLPKIQLYSPVQADTPMEIIVSNVFIDIDYNIRFEGNILGIYEGPLKDFPSVGGYKTKLEPTTFGPDCPDYSCNDSYNVTLWINSRETGLGKRICMDIVTFAGADKGCSYLSPSFDVLARQVTKEEQVLKSTDLEGIIEGQICDPEAKDKDEEYSVCPGGTTCQFRLGPTKLDPGDFLCIRPLSAFTGEDLPFSALTCAEGKDENGELITKEQIEEEQARGEYTLTNSITKCLSINTAIGPISTEPQAFIRRIFSIVLGLAGGIALVLIMISGYKFMISQGNPEKMADAREHLTSAVVGLIFIIFSFVILQVIGVDILRIPGFAP